MEIKLDLNLQQEEQKKIATHSFLNVISIISMVCGLIEIIIDKKDALSKNIEMATSVKNILNDEAALLNALKNINAFEKEYFELLMESLNNIDGAMENPEVIEEIENLKSIFEVVRRRSAEMVIRLENGITWNTYEISEIEANFTQFFDAVEKNAKGRYRIIYNLADKLIGDYLVHLKIESENGKTVFIPDILIDIMRDLIANARKYTPPGGTIDSGLTDHKNEIRFSVSDTGIGIPKGEIEDVVKYGFRGSNTGQYKTFGAGFGLTKAYEYVKNANGKMWIESELGRGTKLTISIPKP